MYFYTSVDSGPPISEVDITLRSYVFLTHKDGSNNSSLSLSIWIYEHCFQTDLKNVKSS